MTPYRTEAAETELSPTVEISRERLAHLERCEAVLEEVDASFAVDSFDYGRRRKWEVQLYTGEYADMYPCTVEGYGSTLREAIEDAMDWNPVPHVGPPEFEMRKVPLGWFLALGMLVGVLIGRVI
jgi:hypothetical protein